MKTPLHLCLATCTAAVLVLPAADALTEILPHVPLLLHDAPTLDIPLLLSQAHAPPAAATFSWNPLALYMKTLASNPLPTKMATGATLAFTGDWIAQSRVPEEPYDKRRAASFALFDSAYRASQHFLYPIVVATCQGQFLGSLVQATPVDIDPASAAAMEQTLVSQLLIVPLLYYPVFYGVTSFVQGLSWEGTVERAQQTFLPLMKRNLMFWIPVQFIQFSFLPEHVQIPFLSVCGLCWTLILSVMAGSAKAFHNNNTTITTTQQTVAEEEPYCVTGMEEGCFVEDAEGELFPHATLQEMTVQVIDIAHEVSELAHDVTEEIIDVAHEVTDEMIEIANEVTHEWEEITHRVLGDHVHDGDNDDNEDDDDSTNSQAKPWTREKEWA